MSEYFKVIGLAVTEKYNNIRVGWAFRFSTVEIGLKKYVLDIKKLIVGGPTQRMKQKQKIVLEGCK